MSDFKPHHIDSIRDMLDRLTVEVERLHGLPQHADLSHTIIKLESARRGLQDAIRKLT